MDELKPGCGVTKSQQLTDYINGLVCGDYVGWTRDQIAENLGISPRTLWTWDKKIDWPKVMSERRALYKREILEVDSAMLKEAKKGDVRAAEIVYRRFDGYIPTEAVMGLEGKTDADLEAMAAEIRKDILAQREADAGSGVGSNKPGDGAKAAE